MAEYDPATCVTALELRELGIPVPELIPDVAWIRRAALRMSLEDVAYGKEDKNLVLDFTIEFMEPLQWIQLDFVVTDGTGGDPPA